MSEPSIRRYQEPVTVNRIAESTTDAGEPAPS